MNKFLLITILCSVIHLFSQTATAPSSGDGTSGDPYQIASLENLYWIASNSTVWNKYFIQTADIDASETKTWFEGAGWTPIGQGSGSYNGQGHTISGLYINRPVEINVGLFKQLRYIDDLGVINCDVTGGEGVGCLSGYGVYITNCYSTGSVIGENAVGGLTGWFSGTLTNCRSEGIVTGGSHAGGLVGSSDYGTIQNCYSKGLVSGTSYVGGLIGFSYGAVNYSYSEAEVSGTSIVGSLAGFSFGGEFKNSYSTGNVSGTNSVGGIIGAYQPDYYDGWDYITFNNKIINCYAKGTVSGSQDTGGLIGDSYSWWKKESKFDLKAINFENKSDSKGLTVTSSFWDIETTGQTTSVGGGNGKTTAEMLSMSTYTNAGWDFYGETANGTADIWSMDALYNSGYPFQSWQIVPTGTGTESDPYLISTAGNLLWLSGDSDKWDNYFVQTADIDISSINTGSGFRPIGNGTTKFTGHYDGRGYVIDGLFIDLPYIYRVGMFGNIIYAEIKNLKIINADVNGYASVGVITGYAVNSDIMNCSTSGRVTGTDNVGGIAGYIHYETTISASASSCDVTGIRYSGGLCGYSTFSSSISDCYSLGAVYSSDYAGGFIGYNNNSAITVNCYSTGIVSGAGMKGGFAAGNFNGAEVSGCFWDTEESGQSTSAGGTGKLTSEMKTLSTFTASGWDFKGETVNGTDDYWNINGSDNGGYPFLRWQFPVFEAPGNVAVSASGTNIIIGWDANPTIVSYSVYSSEDPYADFPAGWTQEASGLTGTSWTDIDPIDTKKFYIVVAVSGKETEPVAKKIVVKKNVHLK